MYKTQLSIQEIEYLNRSNNLVKGTNQYSKYNMECSAKTDKKWFFCGWGVPHNTTIPLVIKKYMNNYYIMQEGYRYSVSEEVNKLLRIY